MGLCKQLCGEQGVFKGVAAEGQCRGPRGATHAGTGGTLAPPQEIWLFFPSSIGLRLSPLIGIKKAWVYFIRKVYETDPLICPGWQPGVYSGRGFLAILVKGKLKWVNTLCPMNWWANSNGWR